jgi:dihydrofolate reductase
MYPGYEQYWTAIQNAPDEPLPMTGRIATAGEREWARFAAQTTHFVLSNTLTSAQWSGTRFLRNIRDIAALKRQPGKDIYLMGGAQMTSSAIDAGILDELRLIVHPLLVGTGKQLFVGNHRRRLQLRNVRQLAQGSLGLVYGITATCSDVPN